MKRFISCLITFTLLFSFISSAYAYNSNELKNNKINIPPENDIKEYAVNFMQNSQDDNSINIKEFISLYNFEENTTGYYITFDRSGNNAGYIILSLLTEDSPVVEFSFDGCGPIEEFRNQNSIYTLTSNNYLDNDEKFIYTGPDNLFVPVNNEYYSVYENKNYSKTDVKKKTLTAQNRSSKGDLCDGIIDWNQASIDDSSVFKLSQFGSGTDYWLMNNFMYGGVCAPTAATNILWYWGSKRGRSSIMDKYEVYNKKTIYKKRKQYLIYYLRV